MAVATGRGFPQLPQAAHDHFSFILLVNHWIRLGFVISITGEWGSYERTTSGPFFTSEIRERFCDMFVAAKVRVQRIGELWDILGTLHAKLAAANAAKSSSSQSSSKGKHPAEHQPRTYIEIGTTNSGRASLNRRTKPERLWGRAEAFCQTPVRRITDRRVHRG
jgi:hypothetical protein